MITLISHRGTLRITLLSVSLENVRRYQMEYFVPSTLSGVVLLAEFLTPDFVHGLFERDEILRVKAVELRVLSAELFQIWNDDDVKGVKVDYRTLNRAHESH